jgi:hypothetical protein
MNVERTGKGNQSTWSKPNLVLLFPPHIPLELGSKPGCCSGKPVTAWVMVQPEHMMETKITIPQVSLNAQDSSSIRFTTQNVTYFHSFE